MVRTVFMANTDKRMRTEGESGLVQTAPKLRTATRVLAVDDEPAACKLLSLILSPPDFRCMTANSGNEALACLKSQEFDAVISDLHMPGMSGMEFLNHVRRAYPHIAFLVTTGVDDLDVGVGAMRCGADDYLVKPLRETAVLASLRNAIHKRQLEEQVESYRQHLEDMVADRTAQLREALYQVERSYETTLQALGAAIDLRDSETAGHSRRVCRYSVEIAQAMGWSNRQLVVLARGAYLHDIGKLGIPDRILLKPGALTVEERKLMQVHSEVGFDLVKDIPFLADAAEIVLTHHERYDGSGYPRGLRADEILPGARIFGVADTLDAITSDRPYRRASSFETAREVISREAGRLFDPGIVDAYLNIRPDTWPSMAKEQGQSVAILSALRRDNTFLPGDSKLFPAIGVLSNGERSAE
jgi:response regulator RpfG family c-di-GMP phosphodiesterase